MDTKVTSSRVRYTVPENYIRPVDQQPNLSQVSDCEDVQVIDLGCGDRGLTSHQIRVACPEYEIVQVINYAVTWETVDTMQGVVSEFFRLPVEEKLKLETVQNGRDYRRLHRYNLDQYTPEWPSNPPTSNSVHIDMQGITAVHPEHSPCRSSLINQLYKIYLIFMGILLPTISQVSDHASTTAVLMGTSLAMLFINILAASSVYYQTGKLTDSWFSFVLYTIFIIIGILSPVLAFSNLLL